MNTRLIALAVPAMACAALLAGCGSAEQAAAIAAAEKAAERAADIHAIHNLMSRRAFYHSAGRNDLEFELYADKVADISWGQNQGFKVGHESINKFYVDANNENRRKELDRLRKIYPDIKDEERNLGVGTFVIHSLTTPIIEVAGDGMTAKGVWYTPGAIGMTDAKGKLGGAWLWERYGVDFIKEDGEWKFWHILVLTDFMSEMGKPLAAMNAAPVGTESGDQAQSQNGAQWDAVATDPYQAWGPNVAQQIAPRLPEPYETFSATFSYGPPASN